MWWPLALASCLVGRPARRLHRLLPRLLLRREGAQPAADPQVPDARRETQIKGYFHRHGFKILILGRFAVGFRTAAYLTAGILKLPTLKLFLTDLFAASLSTFLMFGLGYAFAHQIQTNFDRVKHWLMAVAALALVSWLLYRYYKARRRAGRPVGPPVLESDDVPLPPDDLHALSGEFRTVGAAVTAPVPAPAPAPVPSAAPAAPNAEAGSNGPVEQQPGTVVVVVSPGPVEQVAPTPEPAHPEASSSGPTMRKG